MQIIQLCKRWYPALFLSFHFLYKNTFVMRILLLFLIFNTTAQISAQTIAFGSCHKVNDPKSDLILDDSFGLDRKISTSMKWLISFARKRSEKSMAQKLAAEILAASKEEGAAVKKRVDTHKMAEANKAFSHFRF